MLPVLFAGFPVLAIIIAMQLVLRPDIIQHEHLSIIVSCSISSISIYFLLNNMLTLLIIRPYRKFLVGLVKKQVTVTAPISFLI